MKGKAFALSITQQWPGNQGAQVSEINNATRPLRAGAAAAGDPDRMSLYAGQEFRAASDRPAAEIIRALVAGTRAPQAP